MVTLTFSIRVGRVQSQVYSLVILLLLTLTDDMCYIANVGDSRALLSLDGGNYTGVLSNDHKPNDDNEQKRITEAGGKIYQYAYYSF